jgi:hypothetical protein
MRIRTIKPEFWEDEGIGLLSRDARLLFAATFNMADDEGLLRWTPAFIKSQAFIYDDDVTAVVADLLMKELEAAGMVYAYVGGKAHQQLGMVVNFHRHQRVNRPQPSKLPAPSLQNLDVRQMYARRDGHLCHLCGHPTNDPTTLLSIDTDALEASPDHVKAKADGGTDYPSNIRNSHIGCNKARANRPVADFRMPLSVARQLGLNSSLSDSVNDSVNDARTDSLPEGEGEGEGEGEQGMESVVQSSGNPQLVEANGKRWTMTETSLKQIAELTNGDTAWALKVSGEILTRATGEVRSPGGFVLRSIRAEPERHRRQRAAPSKAQQCPKHPGQWPDNCGPCAADRIAGDHDE